MKPGDQLVPNLLRMLPKFNLFCATSDKAGKACAAFLTKLTAGMTFKEEILEDRFGV